MTEKFVLCRPQGGLNDMLCQMESCLRYCRKHGRIFVLDTRRSGLRDDFDRYFTFADTIGVKTVPYRQIAAELEDKSTLPAAVQGRLGSYEPAKLRGGRCKDALSEAPLEFDLKVPHTADVLVHERRGGGINSYWLLQHLIPTPLALEALRERLAGLPKGYVSLHIRNTDLRTDYRKFVTAIAWALRDRHVLVATDSGEIQSVLPEMGLGEKKFHYLTQLDPQNDAPLHDTSTTTQDSNLEMLCDLFALALGDRLYFTFTEKGHISGFSGLAFGLSRSKLARSVALEIGFQQGRSQRSFHLNGLIRFTQNQLLILVAKLGVAGAMRMNER